MRKPLLAASLVALAIPAIIPALSSAAPSAVTVVTHSANHLDTTTVSGPATQDSPGGPVWALDNLSLRYDVTPAGVDPVSGVKQWTVAIESQGSFAGFASPTTGEADINNGSTKGNITYTVTSNNAPNKAAVPAQEPDSSSIRLPIIQMFNLPDASSIVQSGDYSFTYNQVDGVTYTQH